MRKLSLKEMTFLVWLFLLPMSMAQGDTPKKEDILLFSRYSGSNWQIWVKDLTTGEEMQLTDSAVDKRAPQCDQAGEMIVYRTANSELVRMDLNTREEEKILTRFGTIQDQHLSSDGKKMVFARLESDLMDDSDVWIADLEGESPRLLTNQPGLQYGPIISSDGKTIVYVSQDKNDNSDNLWQMDTEGNNKTQLTEGKFYDLSPDLSTDGGKIAFSSNRTGNFDIWLLDLTANKLEKLTEFSGLDTSPAFSADGEKIAFVSTRSGTKQIWLMDEDGRNVRQVTLNEKASCQEPSWCPGLKVRRR